MLLAEREEATVLPAAGTSVRTLRLPECQGVPVAKQNHHTGRRLCFEWYLQLYNTTQGSLQIEDFVEPNHFTAGAQTGHCILRLHILLPSCLLDAWFN